MFERYRKDGESLGTLSRWLNAQGVRTNAGTAWDTLPLGRLLRNPPFARADAAVYRYLRGKGAAMNGPIGQYEGVRGCYCYAPLATAPAGRKPPRNKFSGMPHSFVTPAPHEGLIDAMLWLEVQHKLDPNKALKNSGAGTHSWLSGLMKRSHRGYATTAAAHPCKAVFCRIALGRASQDSLAGSPSRLCIPLLESLGIFENLRRGSGIRAGQPEHCCKIGRDVILYT